MQSSWKSYLLVITLVSVIATIGILANPVMTEFGAGSKVTSAMLAVGPERRLDKAAPTLPVKDFSGRIPVKVLRITAACTVVLLLNQKETKVSLLGLDISRTVVGNRPGKLSEKDRVRVMTNLLKGESVYVEYAKGGVPERNERDHILAYLFRAPDGLFVNLEFVRQGYAPVQTKEQFEYKEVFDFYQRKAKAVKKGIWEQPQSKNAEQQLKPLIVKLRVAMKIGDSPRLTKSIAIRIRRIVAHSAQLENILQNDLQMGLPELSDLIDECDADIENAKEAVISKRDRRKSIERKEREYRRQQRRKGRSELRSRKRSKSMKIE